VCKIFKCFAQSLLRWVDKYNENGKIKRHNRKAVAYKVHKDQVKFILDEIKKNKTNSIENYFSILKSRLQKLDGLTHEKLKENIEKVIKDIPKEKYENIFKGVYIEQKNMYAET